MEKETGRAFSVTSVAGVLKELVLRKISDLRIDQALSAVGA
jgi:hypothetical protein